MIINDLKKTARHTSFIVTICYIIFLYFSTVINRTTQALRKYDFQPFWSYKEIQNGREDITEEVILNIIVFIPIGFLLRCSFGTINWKTALIFGSMLSVSIESLQFIVKRGFAEVDDVIHNTLGCMVGYGLYLLIKYGYEKLSKKNMGVL